jgi:hypothetical protein
VDKEIIKFWKWWVKNDVLIRKVLEQGSEAKMLELKEHFDRKILDFGHFTWEINEGKGKAYSFVLSPNREFERLQLSKKIIRNAPELEHWEFLYAKQPNKKPEPFKLYDENLDPVLINPSDWQIEFEGGIAKVTADELKGVDHETRQHAIDLVVTAYLGEEFRILKVKEIVLL